MHRQAISCASSSLRLLMRTYLRFIDVSLSPPTVSPSLATCLPASRCLLSASPATHAAVRLFGWRRQQSRSLSLSLSMTRTHFHLKQLLILISFPCFRLCFHCHSRIIGCPRRVI